MAEQEEKQSIVSLGSLQWDDTIESIQTLIDDVLASPIARPFSSRSSEAPEVKEQSDFPEALCANNPHAPAGGQDDDDDDNEKNIAPTMARSSSFYTRHKKWLVTLGIFLVLAAIGLGVGVGWISSLKSKSIEAPSSIKALNEATITRSYNSTMGTCGCGSQSGGAFPWVLNAGHGFYTASASPSLFAHFGGSSCGQGCGTCYNLTATNNSTCVGCGASGDAEESIIVMVTNLCDDSQQWCPSSGQNSYGSSNHFSLNTNGSVLGDNGVVKFEPIACPATARSSFQQCECSREEDGGDQVITTVLTRMSTLVTTAFTVSATVSVSSTPVGPHSTTISSLGRPTQASTSDNSGHLFIEKESSYEATSLYTVISSTHYGGAVTYSTLPSMLSTAVISPSFTALTTEDDRYLSEETSKISSAISTDPILVATSGTIPSRKDSYVYTFYFHVHQYPTSTVLEGESMTSTLAKTTPTSADSTSKSLVSSTPPAPKGSTLVTSTNFPHPTSADPTSFSSGHITTSTSTDTTLPTPTHYIPPIPTGGRPIIPINITLHFPMNITSTILEAIIPPALESAIPAIIEGLEPLLPDGVTPLTSEATTSPNSEGIISSIPEGLIPHLHPDVPPYTPQHITSPASSNNLPQITRGVTSSSLKHSIFSIPIESSHPIKPTSSTNLESPVKPALSGKSTPPTPAGSTTDSKSLISSVPASTPAAEPAVSVSRSAVARASSSRARVMSPTRNPGSTFSKMPFIVAMSSTMTKVSTASTTVASTRNQGSRQTGSSVSITVPFVEGPDVGPGTFSATSTSNGQWYNYSRSSHVFTTAGPTLNSSDHTTSRDHNNTTSFMVTITSATPSNSSASSIKLFTMASITAAANITASGTIASISNSNQSSSSRGYNSTAVTVVSITATPTSNNSQYHPSRADNSTSSSTAFITETPTSNSSYHGQNHGHNRTTGFTASGSTLATYNLSNSQHAFSRGHNSTTGFVVSITASPILNSGLYSSSRGINQTTSYVLAIITTSTLESTRNTSSQTRGDNRTTSSILPSITVGVSPSGHDTSSGHASTTVPSANSDWNATSAGSNTTASLSMSSTAVDALYTGHSTTRIYTFPSNSSQDTLSQSSTRTTNLLVPTTTIDASSVGHNASNTYISTKASTSDNNRDTFPEDSNRTTSSFIPVSTADALLSEHTMTSSYASVPDGSWLTTPRSSNNAPSIIASTTLIDTQSAGSAMSSIYISASALIPAFAPVLTLTSILVPIPAPTSDGSWSTTFRSSNGGIIETLITTTTSQVQPTRHRFTNSSSTIIN